MKPISVPSVVFLSIAAIAAAADQQPSTPHLENRGNATQLIVGGKPFLMLAGELYNNSASNLDYMKPIWPRLAAMRLNTVLAPISWGQLEPSPGKFDYTLVDGLIRDARANNLHLVFLWFGSWKNTWSSYAPEWIKRDFEKFPRVQLHDGSGTERLSPFSAANRDADAQAFAALMRRIHEMDGDRQTVLMIQVENEVGVIPDARDHSAAANTAYQAPVPPELMHYLEQHKESIDPKLRSRWGAAGFKSSGNWEAVFGPGPETDDLFMAWQYARYMGKVTEAGKAEYPLPMYANAALIRPDYAPGQYNSGGPLPHSMDLWRAGAPQLDFVAPDIYFEFQKWSGAYDRPGNPLFVPEAAGGAQGAANAFYAIGQQKALGFSPFGIDGEASKPLEQSYAVLSELAPLILENQGKGMVAAALLEDLTPSQKIRLGDYTLNVTGVRATGPAAGQAAAPAPHAIFIATGPEEIYMAGSGVSVTISPNTPGPPIVGLGTVEEGHFIDGKWTPDRVLAGDDTGQGNNISLTGGRAGSILRVTLYRYR